MKHKLKIIGNVVGGVVLFGALLFLILTLLTSAGGSSYHSSRGFGPFIGICAGILLMLGAFAALAYSFDRRAKKMNMILDEDQLEPAFTVELSVKELQNGVLLEQLRGKVSKVCVMRNMEGSNVGTSNALSYSFASFVIDTHGVSHDLEEHHQHARVEANGRWLAEALGVPFEDISYG